MSPRNILVQPGPLHVPYAQRTLETPSYRIIDFGRGINENRGDGSEHGFPSKKIEEYMWNELANARILLAPSSEFEPSRFF